MIGGILITKQQRYLAGRTDLVALLRSRGETLKRLGSEWEWKFHEERVTIRGHLWFDQYTQKGGDAVGFFHYFYGESEEQAAAMLLNCSLSDLEKLPARSPPNLHTPLKKCSLTADDGALSPLKWCAHSAEMVHGGRERGAPGRHAGGITRGCLCACAWIHPRSG